MYYMFDSRETISMYPGANIIISWRELLLVVYSVCIDTYVQDATGKSLDIVVSYETTRYQLRA